METLFFITGNKNKISEMAAIMPSNYSLKGLSDLGYSNELPETSQFLENNSLEKLLPIVSRFQVNGFAEDTGLEVDSLGGAPGVYSARYAGSDKNPAENIDKLLDELHGKKDREAQFRTSLCLFLHNQFYHFEGIIRGQIAHSRAGRGGFGYDPVFVPEGYQKTFAELSASIKNSISHRARAAKQMLDFLRQYQ